jgi:hypothetical protein
MIQMTEAKLVDLLERAYKAGARGVWEWQLNTNRVPRLPQPPTLPMIQAEALAPLIEEAKQK